MVQPVMLAVVGMKQARSFGAHWTPSLPSCIVGVDVNVRSRAFLIVVLGLGSCATAPAMADVVNWQGNWRSDNGDCPTNCNLRGVRSDITPATDKFTMLSGQAGIAGVIWSMPNSQGLAQAGMIQTNNPPTAFDCSVDTAPNIVQFSEIVPDNPNLPGTCHQYGVIDSSNTSLYKAQRKMDSTCVASARPNCVATFINGDVKQVISANLGVADYVLAQGELLTDTVNGNTDVHVKFPGPGTNQWARTSSIFDNGITDTWTVITSAHCEDDHNKWYVGSLGGGGFNIYYAPGSNTGSQC
jgi:hypothetical protein